MRRSDDEGGTNEWRAPAGSAAARALPCALEWHPGFRLHVDELRRHPEFRGPEIVALGERLAVHGWLTPAVLGDAARAACHDRQAIKRVWHYVARFGDLSATRGA